MKTTCRILGLVRAHLQDLKSRPASWCDGRTERTPAHDADLLADIREQIAQLPSYGYLPRHGRQRLAAAQGTAPAAIEPSP